MPDRALLIIASDDFSAEEFQTCKEIFQTHHYGLDVASNKVGNCENDRGTKVWCSKRASEVAAEDYEIIVIIGGYGASELLEDHGVSDLIFEAERVGMVLGAIGQGVKVLAASDILDGRKATAPEDQIEELKNQGIHILSQNVVKDGLIITAKDADDADEFMHALLDAV